jgi:hypothetical protein
MNHSIQNFHQTQKIHLYLKNRLIQLIHFLRLIQKNHHYLKNPNLLMNQTHPKYLMFQKNHLIPKSQKNHLNHLFQPYRQRH